MLETAQTMSSAPGIHARLHDFFTTALDFIAPDRADALLRKWAPRDRSHSSITDDRMMTMMADAICLSADLLVSQPSASGSTAFDRLTRSLGKVSSSDSAALAALGKARFRLLQVQETKTDGRVTVQDILAAETLSIEGGDLPPIPTEIVLFARVVLTHDRCGCLVGAITPLDSTALSVAQAHAAAGGNGSFANARWAEAVYTHVVRHGTVQISGLNRPPADAIEPDLYEEIDQALRVLAHDWAALAGKPPGQELMLCARRLADKTRILDALDAALTARDAKDDPMADAFECIAAVQLETVSLRERGGSAGLTLDIIARTLDEAIATRNWPPRIRPLFDRLRPRTGNRQANSDLPLDRLVQRIQGLRAKTVAQGCTEQEALAAAEKVAELLDRYGLFLSELELQAQPCEGIGIQTNRRRMAPIDECIPAIAAFFDCRVWVERAQGAPLRYIFFGLRGDVTAAQYLYEMVERAFDTETAIFRISDLYNEMAGDRRSATNSFQIGLSRGIRAKLHAMRAARDETIRSASGRDLVPVKAAIIEDEMSKLGLNLSRKSRVTGKLVIPDAYTAGQEAGKRFEFMPGITAAA